MISRYLLLLASAIILSLSYATAAKAQMLYVTFDGNGAPGEYYAKDTCLAKVVKNTAARGTMAKLSSSANTRRWQFRSILTRNLIPN
jgi:hypothetical protein